MTKYVLSTGCEKMRWFAENYVCLSGLLKMQTTRPKAGKQLSGGGEKNRPRKTPVRKNTYRVGYTWNRGGRLKELRIR